MKKIFNSIKTNRLILLIILLAFAIRVWNILTSPPSLYWDEVSIGYNAWSIAHTLRDEFGSILPIQSFTAFGDYKGPLYIYLTAPFTLLFGLNYFSVRFISILSGSLLVLATYLISLELFKNRRIALIAAILVAISPWSIQLSRAAFEGNLGATLASFGSLFFLKSIKNPKLIFWSTIFFALAMYAFNGTRYFLPFWFIALAAYLIIFNREYFRKNIKYLLVSVTLLVVLVSPLISFGLTNSGQLRFNEVNIFSDPKPVELSNNLIAENHNSTMAKIIYNRRVFYGIEFLQKYFDHYRFDYLFTSGDVNPRFSSHVVGEMYLVDLPFLVLGAYFMFRKNRRAFFLVTAWIVLSPIPASVARETPHALRTVHILPALMILSAFGIYNTVKLFSKKYRPIAGFLAATAYLLFFSYFYSNYQFTYPKTYANEWQDGYRQLASVLKDSYQKYDHVYLSDYFGRPYINLIYYWQVPPQEYLQNRQAFSEPSGLWTVTSYKNIIFTPTISCGLAKGHDLLIGKVDELTNVKNKIIISDSFNQPKFVMIDSNECQN